MFWLTKPQLRVNDVNGEIAAYIVPREKALELSTGANKDGNRRLRCSHEELQRYRKNFRLQNEP